MLRLIVLIAALLSACTATAADFCVETLQELRSALIIAGTNGQNDRIRVKSGIYETGSTNELALEIFEPTRVELSGGWSDSGSVPCATQTLDVRATQLSGNGVRRILRIVGDSDAANVEVSNLTFRDSSSPTQFIAGAVRVAFESPNAEVLFDRVLFENNTSTGGAALFVADIKRLTVRNSLFQLNTVGTLGGVVSISLSQDQQQVLLINNTVINNTVISPDPFSCVGVQFKLSTGIISPEILLVNNLFWDNLGFEVCVPDQATTYYYNNNFLNWLGPPDFFSENLAMFPLLEPDPLDITPQSISPMVNAGRPESFFRSRGFPLPFDWSYGELDFYGLPSGRVRRGRVDIGAAESAFPDWISCDGFELQIRNPCPE